MATDAASLILKIDSTQVEKGVGELDKLTAAGARAEGQTDKLAASTKSVGASASAMAAQAQMASRAAVGFSTGATTVARTTGLAAYQAQNLAFQLNDVATGLASGQAPMRVLAQQGGQFVQIMQQSGLGAKGFARALLEMVGILKVTKDAELAAEAAAAAANAASLKAVVDRTSAAIASADVEVALASAQLRTATTSEAASAAQARLAAAHQAVAAAAGEATVAETALADANAAAATTAQASNSATVVGVGRVGVALGVTAVAAGILAAAFADVKREAGDGNWQQMAKNAGLTRDEIKKLTDTTVTWGDVFASTMDVILERGGVSAQGVKSAWEVALQGVMDFGKFSVAMLLAGFAGLVRGVGSAFINLGKIVANAIGGAANAVIAGIEAMLNKAIDAVNTMATKANSVINLLPEPIRKALGIGNFGQADHASLGRVPVGGFDLSNPLADALGQVHSTFDDVMGGFDAISSRASGRRDTRVGSQINEMLLDRKGKSGGGRGAANDNAAKALDDQTKAYEQALKAGQAFEAQIQKETDSIGQDAIAQKRMEVATQAATLRKMAATAPTQALKDALNQEADAVLAAGAAWEKVTKEQATADFIKNTIEPLERQVSLLGLSAEAQARANLEAEKGAIIAKAGAAAWERYYAAQSAIITDQFKAKNPLQEWLESVPHTAAQVANSLQQIAVKGFDSLASGITEVIMGTKSLGAAFKDVARSIIADIIQMTVRMLIFRAISGLFGGGTPFDVSGDTADINAALGYAKGGVFSGGNVVPFAVGGIVSGPTLFPMSGGRTGLMGEAGPEAVMPLARDSQGRLGVRAGNDNTQRVVVELTLDNELLGARIVEGANAVVEIKRPGIVSQSVNATMRTANRPVLMGRR